MRERTCTHRTTHSAGHRAAGRLLSTLVTTVAVLAALPGIAAAATGFSDVGEGEYYADAVTWLVGEGITTGIEPGCFGPDEFVTRGQIATFLYRLEQARGSEPEPQPHPFADVAAEYQSEPVGWLFATGVTTGTGPRSYSPSASITRGDFAVMLWRLAGEPAAAAPHAFLDITKRYQNRAVSWMAGSAITTGTSPATFDPDGLVTRAQAATFLYRFEGQPAPSRDVDSRECVREMRTALVVGGLTPAEAACAAPHLTYWPVDYLLDVVADRIDASQDWDLLFTVAQVAEECLTPRRIAELTRLFL